MLLAELFESPDFGYKHFVDRDADISNLLWNVEVERQNDRIEAITIRARDKESKNGLSEGFILGRRTVNGKLQVAVSKLTPNRGWQSTGLGQTLYDKLIVEAKKAGFKYLISDYILSGDARKAWAKLWKRYDVTIEDEYEDGERYKCFQIDLTKVALKEDVGDREYTKSEDWGFNRRRTILYINGKPKGLLDLEIPNPKNEGSEWSFDIPIEQAEMVADVQIDPVYRNRGYGWTLYNQAMLDAKKRGMKLFISGNPQSAAALRIWNSLAREGKVKKNRDWGMYVDLMTARLIESPDFGYSQYHNKEADLNKMEFKEAPYKFGFAINALFNKKLVGYIDILEHDVARVSFIKIDFKWRGTGVGQMLYDKAIQVAKSKGLETFESDRTLSADARSAWVKLAKRYKVRHVKDTDSDYYFINLKKIK
jgi:GNAT superfamily N-acetyltransferase